LTHLVLKCKKKWKYGSMEEGMKDELRSEKMGGEIKGRGGGNVTKCCVLSIAQSAHTDRYVSFEIGMRYEETVHRSTYGRDLLFLSLQWWINLANELIKLLRAFYAEKKKAEN
jgi:hypothetical protein